MKKAILPMLVAATVLVGCSTYTPPHSEPVVCSGKIEYRGALQTVHMTKLHTNPDGERWFYVRTGLAPGAQDALRFQPWYKESEIKALKCKN